MSGHLIPPPTDTSWLKTESASGRRAFRDPFNFLLCRPGLREILSRIEARLERMETAMSEQSTALNEGLAELGTAITDLSARIDELPLDANDVTQEQVDTLRAVIGRVKGLAVQAPEVPTPDLPTEPALPENPEVGPEPTTPQV